MRMTGRAFRNLLIVPLIRKAQLLQRVQDLEKENESLRLRLGGAQSMKVVAEEQAEKLRQEKERLRSRVAAMKKSAAQSERITQQLRERFEALQEQHAKLELEWEANDSNSKPT